MVVVKTTGNKLKATLDHFHPSSVLEEAKIQDPQLDRIRSKGKPSQGIKVRRNETVHYTQASAYRVLFDKLPLGIVLIEVKTHKIIECNTEFERQSGRLINELRGMRIWEVIPPPYSNSLMRQFRSQGQRSGYHSIEQKILKPDGSFIEAKFDSCSVEIGEKEYIQTVVYDITESKKMEDALKESEEFNSSLLDSSPYPIVVNNIDTSIIYVNRAFEEATGFRAEEMLGLQAPYPWWADVTKCKGKSDLIRILRREKSGREDIFQHKNGQKIIVEINTKPIKINGKFKGCLTSWVDVTAHRQDEKALKESEQYNASLLNNSPNPVLVINPDTSIRYINPALQKLTGFSLGELIGQKLPYPWSTEEDVEKYTIPATQTLPKGKRKIEKRIKNKHGEPCWIQITSTSISEGHKVKYYLSNWVDISERKKSEEHLLTLNKELRSLSAHLETIRENERARIAREIHDELGQSLAVLKMDVCWLSSNLSKDQNSLRELADSMAKSIDIIVQRIKRLCIELRPKLLDDIGIGGTIEWLASEFEKTTNIKCQVVCDDLNEKTLPGDKATAIFRIFQEALTNVYQHSKATAVSISLTRVDNQTVLKVSDNGIGIKQDQISSPKSFGLIGMRERVHYFGGDLEIEGIHNVGTNVTVRIPLPREVK